MGRPKGSKNRPKTAAVKRGRPKGSKNKTRISKRTKAAERPEQYTHDDSKRPNNPPVGLVTPGTDPDQPSKRYSFDPRLDPQLQWSGKQENAEFDVDTVSLHVHERIDPNTILQKAMKKEPLKLTAFFEDPENNPPLRDAIEFYKHDQNWSNRLIAGDSLLVMNSLLEKEGMEGKVQMVYIDPPYGIKYGSNFQPFVNKKDVKDGKDEDLTQEPEVIKAFRDTWELGIHSYLTYLRNRLYLSKYLLSESGSCFVQISNENLHYVKQLMGEIFGSDNFISLIDFSKTSGFASSYLDSVSDYLVWFAKDKKQLKFRKLFLEKNIGGAGGSLYTRVKLSNGQTRSLTNDEKNNPSLLPDGSQVFRLGDITSQGKAKDDQTFTFQGQTFTPGTNSHWKAKFPEGMERLAEKNRIEITSGGKLAYVRYFNDFPAYSLTNLWDDTGTGGDYKIYVVQTNDKVIRRCMLMTTDPGDLVLDPTCGSGATAFVAEQWGRRWITCDSSRIAIALAKQRLMTGFFDYYEFANPNDGVKSGFKYETVPHVTLGSIANNEQPQTEILYDQPIINKDKTRISGPFTVEAVPSPTVKSIDALYDNPIKQNTVQDAHIPQQQWRDELLKSGIRGKGNQKIKFSRVDSHPTSEWLHADAETKEEHPKRIMVSFGPEHFPLEQRQVQNAITEAQTLVPPPEMIIFAAMQFDPEASKDIDELKWPGVNVLKVEMSKDLLTKDLKKKQSSSESFWFVGEPDIELEPTENEEYVVRVNGFDYYDIQTGKIVPGDRSKIAMWMLDEDYDDRSLYPQQVFFPMAGKKEGWNKLAKTLQANIDENLITKYEGTESIPFKKGPNKKIAVKIIDDRGIESIKILRFKQ